MQRVQEGYQNQALLAKNSGRSNYLPVYPSRSEVNNDHHLLLTSVPGKY